MVKHKLSTEQMRKFVKALGGDNMSEFFGGEFTTRQLIEQAKRIRRSLPENFPEITDDPKVNYAVDCYSMGGEEEPEYDEELGAEEVEAFRVHGAFQSK